MASPQFPPATQAVAIVIGLGVVLSAVMCTAAPASERERWRRTAKHQAPRVVVLLPLVLWSSSALDWDATVAEYLLLFGAVAAVYGVAGIWSSRRLRAAYPEEWMKLKQGAEIDPAVKKRIDGEIARSLLLATFAAAVFIAVLVIGARGG